MEAICKNCGASFVPKRNTQVYCSVRCNHRYNRIRAPKRLCPKHNVQSNKYGNCPECAKGYEKNRRNSPKGRKSIHKWTQSQAGINSRKKYWASEKAKQWRKAHETTAKAKLYNCIKQTVHRAIASGKLKRTPCVICNNPVSFSHHLFGYDKENWLRVVFLCREHHNQADHDPAFNETLKSNGLIV